MSAVSDFQNKNPLLFIIGIVVVGVVAAMNFIPGFRTFGSGISYKKRRALAKARAAKKRKNKKRRK